MKKTFSALLALCLLLCAFPYASAQEEAFCTELEDVNVYGISAASLLGSGGADVLTGDLPQWLIAYLLGRDSAACLPTDSTPAPDVYEPEPYVPFAVTKTKSYYDKNGRLAYTLTLTASFVKTERGYYYLHGETQQQVFSGSWRITAAAPRYADGAVTAAFTVSLLFTGVAIQTQTVELRVTPKERASSGGLRGDANGDGNITAADARFVLRAAVKLETPTALQLRLCDMNGDGVLTAADARAVLQKAVKIN